MFMKQKVETPQQSPSHTFKKQIAQPTTYTHMQRVRNATHSQRTLQSISKTLCAHTHERTTTFRLQLSHPGDRDVEEGLKFTNGIAYRLVSPAHSHTGRQTPALCCAARCTADHPAHKSPKAGMHRKGMDMHRYPHHTGHRVQCAWGRVSPRTHGSPRPRQWAWSTRLEA
jgi:hypothetical protein